MHTLAVGNHTLKFRDEGQGIPLLLIHGFPLTSRAWDAQLDQAGTWGRGFRLIAPDLRGFGHSETVGNIATMDDFADDMAALLNHLKLPSVIVMGHSMGGYVALNWVARFPERTMGLILVGTKAGADSEEAAKKRREIAEKALAGAAEGIVKDMAGKMVAKDSSDHALVAKIETLMQPIQPRGIANALLGMALRPDSAPKLAQIKAPTLIVSGDADVLIPSAESKTLAESIPGAKAETIAGAGHLVTFEKSTEFNAVLKSWLGRFL